MTINKSPNHARSFFYKKEKWSFLISNNMLKKTLKTLRDISSWWVSSAILPTRKSSAQGSLNPVCREGKKGAKLTEFGFLNKERKQRNAKPPQKVKNKKKKESQGVWKNICISVEKEMFWSPNM